jgi:predicted phage terminase large subunit-like protein
MGKGKPQKPSERAVELARTDLAAYATLLYPRFQLPHHLRVLVEVLETVERGEVKRLMVFMPPGHGKSLTASQLFPAWFLGRDPRRYVISASYGQELALDFGRRARNLIADPLHRATFPTCRLSDDSTAAHRFNLTAGGAYYALGAGGPITGRGADLLLIDDPIKNREEAYSASFRRALQAWFESVAYTRLEPDGAIVLIQTRWHQDDLAGWLLREHAGENWRVISLPAIAEGDEGWRREGEALWPRRFPISTLERIREAIGGATWQALYQQRPQAAEGGIFKRGWFKTWRELPARFDRVALSIDAAFKTGSANDYSAAVVVGEAADGYYALHVWRERVEFPMLKRKVGELAALWKPDVVLVEDKASGQSLIQELRSTNLPVIAVKVDTDKETRAHAVSPLVESGRLFLPPDAHWLADFLDEACAFPAGAHDDQVDALTQALGWLRQRQGGDNFIEYLRSSLGAPLTADQPKPLPWAHDRANPDAGGELMALYKRARREGEAVIAARRCASCGEPFVAGETVAEAGSRRWHRTCRPA